MRAPRTTRIAAVGDIMLGEQPLALGFGVRSIAERQGYGSLFADVSAILQRQDIVVGNLEGVLADPQPDEKRSRFFINRAPEEAAIALRNAGFSVLSISNNHIFDYGSRGLQRTVQCLEDAGLGCAGSTARPLLIRVAGGRTIGFAAWSLVPDTCYGSARPESWYNVTDDPRRIAEDIAALRRQVDTLILSIHWGNEFVPQPSRRQQEQAHRWINAGADIVLGHHAHVLQPVERYAGGVIFYCLGNFVSDLWLRPARRSVIVEMELGTSIRYKLVPIVIGTGYRPMLCESATQRDEIVASLSLLKPLGVAEYNRTAIRMRRAFRVSSLRYFLVNLFRYRRSDFRSLVWWGILRALFLVRIWKKETVNPDMVYSQPKACGPGSGQETRK